MRRLLRFKGAVLQGRGLTAMSAEEGLLHRFARRAADVSKGGKGLHDATLRVNTAGGMDFGQLKQRISHACHEADAQATLDTLALCPPGCLDLVTVSLTFAAV